MREAFAQRIGPTDRKKLIAGIHAQASALQLDDDTRRDMQQQLVGVASTKEMTVPQLSTIWQRLTVLAKDAGLTRPRKKSRPGRDERQPDELVTAEQTAKIGELFDALGIAAVGQARMNFSRRTCGSTWPQTREQANKIIEALKAMQARGWRARGAGLAEPPPCSLPAEGEKEEGKEAISGRPSHGDTVHESPITP